MLAEHDQRRKSGVGSVRYAQDIARGSPPAAVTPDDVTGAVLAGDDQSLLIHRGRTFQVLKIGGTPVDAKGFTAGDLLLTWNADASGVVVADVGTLPARIDLVDPWSGRRTRLKDLAPPDGFGTVDNVYWLPDGRGYAYSHEQQVGQLFIVTGWR